MDFWQVLKNRHCVRKFSSEEVAEEDIEKLLAAAKMGPTAGNMQDWRFQVVKNKETKKKLAAAALEQNFIAQAPVVLVISSDLKVAQRHYAERGLELYSIQDVAIAAEHIFLAAIEMGLATCWVGAFTEEEVKEILDLPAQERPMVIMPVGYEK